MDNFRFDMTAEGVGSLASAMKLVFQIRGCEGSNPRGGKRGVTHYAIRPVKEGQKAPDGKWLYNCEPRPLRLVFFNHYDIKKEDGDKTTLPFKLDADGASDFARRWLEEADYGREPDHDGSNGKGWRIYNEGWGHVDNDHYGVIAVTPVWAMYGK